MYWFPGISNRLSIVKVRAVTCFCMEINLIIINHLLLLTEKSHSSKDEDDLSDLETNRPIRSSRNRSHHKKTAVDKTAHLNLVKSEDSSPVQSADDKTTSLKHTIDNPSLPTLIKLRLMSLFSSTEDDESPTMEESGRSKSESFHEQYKKLFEPLLSDDIESLRKPMLEHSLSHPEIEGFAVREFPASSRPPHKAGNRAEDETLTTVKRKSRDITSPLDADHKAYISNHNVPLAEHTAESSIAANSQSSPVLSRSSSDVGIMEPYINKEILSSRNLQLSNTVAKPEQKLPTLTPGGAASDSENEGWVHVTTQAIKTVESQVERLSMVPKKYYLWKHGCEIQRMSNVSDLSVFNRQFSGTVLRDEEYGRERSVSESDGARTTVNDSRKYRENDQYGTKVGSMENSNNGERYSINSVQQVKSGVEISHIKCRQLTRVSSCRSSISSLSSDNGLYSESDADDVGSLFDTDNEMRNDRITENDDDVFIEKESVSKLPAASSATTRHWALRMPTRHKKIVESQEQDELDDKESYKRFYHVFKEDELMALIEKHVKSLHVIESYYDHANWCVVAEKVNTWI